MKVQLDAQVKAVDQLKGNTRMLENKLSEAKSKKDTLKARAKSATTSKQINEMLQGLNTSSASSAFDRMEEKVMSLEGESEAAMQVCGCEQIWQMVMWIVVCQKPHVLLAWLPLVSCLHSCLPTTLCNCTTLQSLQRLVSLCIVSFGATPCSHSSISFSIGFVNVIRYPNKSSCNRFV